jgi:hypothetical protein
MERYYYFIADDGDAVFDDKTGTLLAGDQAARQNAVQIIAELKADASFADSSAKMIVKRGGEEVFRIPFSFIRPARHDSRRRSSESASPQCH